MQQKTKKLVGGAGVFLASAIALSIGPSHTAAHAVEKPQSFGNHPIAVSVGSEQTIPGLSIEAEPTISVADVSHVEIVSEPAPPPTPSELALSVARELVGAPYVYSGASPSGFDCSGLVMYAFSQVGVSLEHSADGIATLGVEVQESDARVGDLVWYPGQHIGFWVSPGLMLDAPTEGRSVSVNAIWGTPTYIRLPL